MQETSCWWSVVDSNCDILDCIKRHPKECKYYTNYKRCKFNPCKFLHTKQLNYDEKIKDISENIETERVNIEIKIKKIDEKIDILDRQIRAIEEYEKRINTFESNLTTMKKALSEKDNHINALKKRVTDIANVNFERSEKIERLEK